MEIDFVNMISNVGFPIAVAVFVLLRLDRSLRDLTIEMKKLSSQLLMFKDQVRDE